MAPAGDGIAVGWREWAGLPDLGIEWLKVKIDTGARTSALHSFFLEPYQHRGASWVHFGVHPFQRDCATEVWCHAPVADRRRVSDSGGHGEWRYLIVTQVWLGSRAWPIELTLTERDTMLFRMLLGRTAMGELTVYPRASYLAGGPGPGASRPV